MVRKTRKNMQNELLSEEKTAYATGNAIFLHMIMKLQEEAMLQIQVFEKYTFRPGPNGKRAAYGPSNFQSQIEF